MKCVVWPYRKELIFKNVLAKFYALRDSSTILFAILTSAK